MKEKSQEFQVGEIVVPLRNEENDRGIWKYYPELTSVEATVLFIDKDVQITGIEDNECLLVDSPDCIVLLTNETSGQKICGWSKSYWIPKRIAESTLYKALKDDDET